MGQFVEYLKSAIKHIIGNGYRTLMTMLGIVIGISAVIAVVSLGNGMTEYVKTSVNELTGNYGILYINSRETTETFSTDDMRILEEELPDIKGVSPNLEGSGTVKSKRGTYKATVSGGSEAFQYSLSNKIYKGQYFTKQQVESGQRVCIMLRDDAKKLFGTEECLGQEVEISLDNKTVNYTIIGLRDSLNDMYSFMMSGQDYMAIIELPYTAMANDFGWNIDKLDQIVLFADQDNLSQRVKDAQKILEIRHGLRGKDAIGAYSMADFSQELDNMLGYASKFLILVSVISLLVGGIGVMNIMLVSVAERTREIGIRKSIGATTGAILTQFLCEAAILTLLGGIIGIVVGIIASYIICSLIGFKVIVTFSSVTGAALFSILIGLFFGIYPARKAAKMKPIDALRV